MGPRVFSILSLLLVLFLLSTFSNAFPSNVDSKRAMDVDQDWTKLTDCYDFLAAVKRSSNCYRRCIIDRIRDVNESEIFSTLQSAVNACVSMAPWRCLDIDRISSPMESPSETYEDFVPPPSLTAERVAIFVDGVDVAREPDWRTSLEVLKYASGCRLRWDHSMDDRRNFTTALAQLQLVALTTSAVCNPREAHGQMCQVSIEGVIKDVMCEHRNDVLKSLDNWTPSAVAHTWWYPFDPYFALRNETTRNVTVCYDFFTIPRLDLRKNEGDFNTLVANVLEKSGYIPLRSELDGMKRRFREFYFNIGNPHCVRKFLAPQFGVNSCGKMTIMKEKVESGERRIKGEVDIDAELIRID